MIREIGIIVAILALVIGYFRWKALHFERPSEIEESVRKAYNDYRVFEEANLKYTVVNVLAEKPGFPERLYKYIPFAEREGFVDVRLAISPYKKDSTQLPSPDEIEKYDLFRSNSVEIRNVTWSNHPVKDGNILIRVHYFKPRHVINGVHAVIVSIAELLGEEVDEQFHSQSKHADIHKPENKR